MRNDMSDHDPDKMLVKVLADAVAHYPNTRKGLEEIITTAYKIGFAAGATAVQLPYTRSDVEEIGHRYFELAKLMGRMEQEASEMLPTPAALAARATQDGGQP
jgi:hypothetical protein